MPLRVENRKDSRGGGIDIYEFTWPTGTKTVVTRNGIALHINSKVARPVADEAYTFCVLNTDTGNRFCFKS